jgi:serine/threonine-protein kinase PpkA
MEIKKLSYIFGAFLLLSLSATARPNGQPLLMPGKQALYQRVLAIPGAQLHNAIGEPGEAITPFTAYYVYARKQQGGEEWLQVGTDRYGKLQGWVRNSDALEWNQGLTVTFREPVNHDRALLFRDAKALQKLASEKNLDNYKQLYQSAVNGTISDRSPVVAIQPPGKLDIRENFYLVPIRQHQDVYIGNEQARMLQVASVPLKTEAGTVAQEKPRNGSYRAGLVFAIDATLSMQPYIDRTREAVMKIYDKLGDAGLLGNVNFGLVAFRDAIRPAPGLDYLTHTYVNLEQGRNPGVFLNNINALKAASVSSKDFIEDAYAGVKQAIEKMDWEGHPARYVVLVTDAGPRDAGDPLSSTGLDARALRALAQEKNIAIFVMHLLTPAAMANHPQDAERYRALATFPGIGSLYYGVPTGDVREFGLALDALAQQITEQVRSTGDLAKPASSGPTPAEKTEAANNQLAALQSKVEKLGYALRMRYLQKTEGGKPPRIFNAWLLDRDIRNPQERTLDVHALLTRDQLSDLHDILRQVLQTAEDGLLSPQNFLNELKSLAATVSRDPELLGTTTATTAGAGNSLADLGFVREYIEDLPYTGEVMNLSLDDWETWPARGQIDFLHRLEDKIDYYRALHDHTDLWISLDGGAIDGDSVFPIALEMLP